MQALSEKEKKQTRRYCVYLKIALRALIMSFVLCALIVPLEMIDDLVFHNDGFQPVGIDTGIALIALCVACFFDTESEEEFDEYSRPQITLTVRKANS